MAGILDLAFASGQSRRRAAREQEERAEARAIAELAERARIARESDEADRAFQREILDKKRSWDIEDTEAARQDLLNQVKLVGGTSDIKGSVPDYLGQVQTGGGRPSFIPLPDSAGGGMFGATGATAGLQDRRQQIINANRATAQRHGVQLPPEFGGGGTGTPASLLLGREKIDAEQEMASDRNDVQQILAQIAEAGADRRTGANIRSRQALEEVAQSGQSQREGIKAGERLASEQLRSLSKKEIENAKNEAKRKEQERDTFYEFERIREIAEIAEEAGMSQPEARIFARTGKDIRRFDSQADARRRKEKTQQALVTHFQSLGFSRPEAEVAAATGKFFPKIKSSEE